MRPNQYILFVTCLLGWLANPVLAAFVSNTGSIGGIIDDFNDGVVDTATWAMATQGSPMAVSETGTELKLVQTLGFNGAYSTFANGIDESDGSPDGSGLIEPKTAGNQNHRLRAVMRRRDPFDDRVAMGLSITTNIHLRTCSDVGDYACVIWDTTGTTAQSTVPIGQVDNRSRFRIEVRNGYGPPGTPTPSELNTITPFYTFGPKPMWDWTGKTRYAFEIDWTAIATVNFKVEEVLRPDQNNDLATDIVDFGVFAGDFGKSGSGGDLNWDGTFSDFDDSGTVDIADFGQLAGAFGQDPIVLLDEPIDWSDPAGGCSDGSCWPTSLGAQIYAHNMGTLWVDYVAIFGDNGSSPEPSPEPASLVLLGISTLALIRRQQR